MRWYSGMRIVVLAVCATIPPMLGCGEKAKQWIDAGVAAHDNFQAWTIKQVGESKVLRAELERRIRELQAMEKELTKLEAEARVRQELLPRQFRDAERELQTTQRSRERLKELLATMGDNLTIGNKQYTRSAAEQMETKLEIEEETQHERLEALQRNQTRIEKVQPVLIAKRDTVRKTLTRVKATREKLDREISEAALAEQFEKAVGGGEASVEEAERRIRTNAEELTVKVRGEIVVSDDVINDAAGDQEMNDLRAALGN